LGEKFKAVMEATETTFRNIPADEATAFVALMKVSLELAKELAIKGSRGEPMTATEIQYIASFTVYFALSTRV
jgi:hypothetical protein